ncbi:MAG: hypothetical protein JWR27_2860 [Aeromicrobium sp.]|nr:hypothetical protein [Aeromicrobium sp.]
MTLRPLVDLSAADWYVQDVASPLLRGRLGPSGFASYARVLHADAGGDRHEGHLSDDLLAVLCDHLARHTATPDDCFFGLWEGYGQIHGGDPVGFLTAFSGPVRWPGRVFGKDRPPPPEPPAFPPDVMDGPLLHVNGLDLFLFTGPIGDAGQWGAATYRSGARRDINSPNLMWPADHAWFVTTSIEEHWTGVGGSEALVDTLLRDDRLEVVRQRYDEGALR